MASTKVYGTAARSGVAKFVVQQLTDDSRLPILRN